MRKRGLLFFTFLLIATLAGCITSPDYTVKLTKELYSQKDSKLPFEVKVMENKKAIKNLKVSVEFMMSNMDHGTYDVELAEGQEGTYSGKVALPMAGKYEAAFTIEQDGKKTEKVINLNVSKPKGIAKMNGEWITEEDITFYKLMNQLQLAMNREAAKAKYSGKQLEEELAYLESQEKVSDDKNQLLTQIIRLRSMAMLANEKGHKATDAEIDTAVNKVREQYDGYNGVKELISGFGEDKFWDAQKKQSKLIVLTQKVQKDLLEKVKKENPHAGQQELYYQAQTEYEELLVSQVSTLEIEIL